ncbi:DMT family transporter [Halovulum dunhuangense]|uniref:DMT family transporter n=1 Tax=Halovulum dunhuangense TaxID=1505036 RepID=A0A849L0N9_9RHOB|nr:DMT family transporter [Halovulum dunhuangense]
MDLWIPITIAAAFAQNLRFMLQKTLKGRLSTLGVTFSRFVYAAPLAWVVVAGLLMQPGVDWPGLTPRALAFGAVGAVAQIVATALVVTLFSLRNFAVGIAFSKTETVMTALLSAAILAEPVTGGAWVAILVTVAGVLLMSGLPSRGNLTGGMLSRAAGIGIASGAIFAMASIGYRGASLSLAQGDFLIRAAVTLALVTTFQTVLMAVWLAFREPGEIGRVIGAWRIAAWVGLTGMLGSLGWFSAFTLMNAAYVKALGQIELVFTVLASVFFFRERITRAEAAGIVLVAGGIILLVLIG